MSLPSLSLASLASAYTGGALTPTDLIRQLYPSLAETRGIFIHLVPLEDLLARCSELESQPATSRGKLWGVPFAVKDNVDVAGIPTTAACEAFKYTPEKSSPAVDQLLAQGGIMVGKTNLDQFASGLVGTRSPYGVAPNAFDDRFIPGGSSSGSAAAVGAGLVTFALGTDTAGSGRVPAGYNGCVGVKPTVGKISSVGVVPACASLDCLTVFARNVAEGVLLAGIMETGVAGAHDVWRRGAPAALVATPELSPGFRFGVPGPEFMEWTGAGGADIAAQSAAQFEAACEKLKAAGGQQVPIDFSPFAAVAALLYQSSFVAERYSGLRSFLDAGSTAGAAGVANGHASGAAKGRAAGPEAALQQQRQLVTDDRLLPVTRAIISGAGKFTATDVYDDMAQMAVLRAAARAQLATVDMLLVPTALEHYLVEEIQEQESKDPPTWERNAKNGRFTNFVNLLDMCGISVPVGMLHVDYSSAAGGGGDGGAARAERLAALGGPLQVVLPFGVTLLAPAWKDEWLWQVAAAVEKASGLGCGPEGHGVKPVRVRRK